jgi:hypothetical protein
MGPFLTLKRNPIPKQRTSINEERNPSNPQRKYLIKERNQLNHQHNSIK